MNRLFPLATFLAGLISTQAVTAPEYFVGGPVHQHDMEIIANYLSRIWSSLTQRSAPGERGRADLFLIPGQPGAWI